MACFAYVTNYFAGKYGWYRLLLAFGHASRGARHRRHTKDGVSATSRTPARVPYVVLLDRAAFCSSRLKRFLAYSLAAEALWATLWAGPIFFLGSVAVSLVGFRIILCLNVVKRI